jgi:DNA polymerase-1
LKTDDYGTPARLSCSAPNLQQIPKRDKELARLFRKAFIADDGMEFNEADWSQCEPRLYAHYSQEPTLIAGYLKDPFEDAHDVVAKALHVERDPTAKRMNMGIFTGMYPKTFAEHMGWPLEKATAAWNKWHERLPRIREFQERAKQALLQRGYVRTILGRRLHLEHPRFAYRAVSKIIQGGNADIMKYKMLEIDQILESDGDKNVQLLASVHDSLNWQSAKTKQGKELSETIKHILVDVQKPPFNLRVPFVIDCHSGRNWAEATFGPEKK